MHPEVTHLDGVVSVKLTASFDGAPTDIDDQARIQAYGDPRVNMGGTFSDPADPTFQFVTGAPEVWAKITSEMPGRVAKFMKNLPVVDPGKQAPAQSPLDVVTNDPVRAARVWAAAVQARIASVVGTLRTLTPPRLTSLPDTSI